MSPLGLFWTPRACYSELFTRGPGPKLKHFLGKPRFNVFVATGWEALENGALVNTHPLSMSIGFFASLSLVLDVQLSSTLTRREIGPGPHGLDALLEAAPRSHPGGVLVPFARPPAPSTCFAPLTESRGYPLSGQEESLLSQRTSILRDQLLEVGIA